MLDLISLHSGLAGIGNLFQKVKGDEPGCLSPQVGELSDLILDF
jgi:hypothetical protein